VGGYILEVAIIGVYIVIGAAITLRLLIYTSELAAYTALLGAIVALRLTLVPKPVIVAAALAATAIRAAIVVIAATIAGVCRAIVLPSLVASFTIVKIEAIIGPANPLFLGDFYRVNSYLVQVYSIRVFRLTTITVIITVLVVLVVVTSCLIEVVLPFYINCQLLGYSNPAIEVIPLRYSNLYIKGISYIAGEPLIETIDLGGTISIINIGKIGILHKEVGKYSKLVLL
jgi:hypothetical protein